MNRNLKLKSLMLSLAFCFCSFAAFAQSRQVSGTVIDKTGEPQIGVSVMVAGTTTGVMTDMDGNYKINVPSDKSVLKFSYIGFAPQEIKVGTKTTINVTMEEDTKALDEVVVIGYGTTKKRDLTGSVSSIQAKQIEEIPVANVAEALSGKLAGVSVTTSEGSPDAEISIRVRGGGSITQDNSPLYIVDGFPVSSISDVSPADIQSIDVLKDASSTAIYGSRGANGVIIITTKTAKEGKFSVSYDGTYGFKKIAKTLDVLNPYQFARAMYERALLTDHLDYYTNAFGLFSDMDLYQYMAGTDWQNEIYGNTGTYFSHNVSVSGGSDKVNFMASYNRTDENAIMMDSEYARNNFSFKMNAKPYKWLRLNFSTRYSDTHVTGAGANDSKASGGESSTSDSRLKHTLTYAPIDYPFGRTTESDEDIDITDEELMGNLYRPDVSVRDNFRMKDDRLYSLNGGITITPIKGLTIRSDYGFERRQNEEKRYYGTTTNESRGHAAIRYKPLVTFSDRTARRIRNTNTIQWEQKNINRAHTYSILVGEETTTTNSYTRSNRVEGMPTIFTPEESFGYLSQGTAISADNKFSYDDKLLSFFARGSYDYKGRYLVTATVRADGSSKFSPANRWGVFPSAAFAWRISDEGFMSGSEDWLSNLKLRLSYGVAGNNNIDSGQYFRSYSSYADSWMDPVDSYWSPGTKLYNEDIKWETTYTYNIGIDFGFFNNRLSGNIELYQNDVKDLLIDKPISGIGYTTMTQNIGSTRNRGVELSLNGAIVATKHWNVDLGFNISYNQNKVVSLGGLDNVLYNSGWTSVGAANNDYILTVGKSVGLMYGYQLDGNGIYSVDDFTWDGKKWVANEGVVDNSSIAGDSWGPGALKLKDLPDANGVKDGKITENDRTVIGNAMPDFTGGFNLSVRYRWFDLSAAFSFSIGNDIYNANKIEFTSNLRYRNRNMLTDTEGRFTHIDWATGERITDADRLKAINAGAKMWSPTLDYCFHSGAVEDGSFLRLNTLTFGYTVPQNLTKKWYIQRARVFFTGTNLFCATKYTGYDPEVSTRRKTPLTPGVDYSAYPKSRGFNFGINLTF